MTPCKSGISLYRWVRPPGAPLTQLCPLTGQVGTGVPGVPPQSIRRSWDTPAWQTGKHLVQGQGRG